MHVVIMGCGRVGSELAARLEQGEHTVSVIDKNPAAFRMLRYQF
ncbi:MAG TPA: NAD-binding protein, partial [Actinomycetes bacterium]